MKYLPLNPQIFIDNRKRFIAKMEKNSIAIFNSNDELPMNGDALHPFVQNSDLFWLLGIEQEDKKVILITDKPEPRFTGVLVLVRPNELKEKWNGHQLRKNEGEEISGMKRIVWLDELEGMLQQWIHLSDTIYLNTNENDRKANEVPVRDYRYAGYMRNRYQIHK